eukprot:532845_1
MAQQTDSPNTINEELISMLNLRVDGKGWSGALFDDVNKIDASSLCKHCNLICCDAVELGCQHNDDEEIFMHCELCLSELVADNGNKCMISGHYNPPLDVARSIRRQILKAIVVCPYSLAFKKRNNLNNNNAQVIDTVGNDEKEG